MQRAFEKRVHSFSANLLITNGGECHLLTSLNMNVDIHISKKVRDTLLRVSRKNRLNFDLT